MIPHLRKTTKYLLIALWCTYEIVSVAVTSVLFLAFRERVGISPLTALRALAPFRDVEFLVGLVSVGYLGFIIIGYFLGWLFFIVEKAPTPRTRDILIALILGITICILALFAAMGFG